MRKLDQNKKTELLYQEKKLTTTTFKCPSCGGEAKFSPKHQKLKCEYCGTLTDVDMSSLVSEQDIGDLLVEAVVDKDVDVYQCSSCGAKEVISKQDIAVSCPFCGTNNIVKKEELSGIKPQGIVPFKIEQQKVSEIANKWAKKRRMAPNDFYKVAQTNNIKGIYNPLFTFDSITESTYKGRLGDRKTRTVGYGKNRRTETYVVYYSVQGSHSGKFDEVLVQASNKIPQNRLDDIAPFSTNDAITYDSSFLRGYTASSNTINGQDGWNIAKNKMSEDIRKDILRKYHYDVIDYLNVDTKFSSNTYKYILVPLYVGVHKYKNKVYNFYVNGLNGKISGESPISFWKALFLTIFIILVVGIIVWSCFVN